MGVISDKIFRIAAFLLLSAFGCTAMAAGTGTAGMWYGLWNSGLGLTPRTSLDRGTHNLYFRLTAQDSPHLVGGQVSAVRFFIDDKTKVKSASVWLSTSYKQGEEPTLIRQDVALDDLRDVSHDQSATVVELTQTVGVLPSSNRYASLFVGVTLQIDDDAQLLAGIGRGPSNSNFIDGSYNAGYGALPIQMLACGPNIASRGVEPVATDVEQVKLRLTDDSLVLTATVVGAEPVSNVDYGVSIDGEQSAPVRYMLPQTIDEYGMTFTLPAAYTVPDVSGEHTLSVTVSGVNGNDNGADVNSATDMLLVLDRMPYKRAVMEEFTGTWCHNCIRGIAGIQLLEQIFGDRFIAITMHSDDPNYDRDPMVVWHYYYSDFYRGKMRILGGLPSCSIDRYIDCDPYCGYNTYGTFLTDQLVDMALDRPAKADISLTAAWTDDSKTAVRYDVVTDFAYSSDNNPFSLILVLTADGLTGDTDRWRQRNGYNDYDGPEEALQVYAGAGNYLTGVVYNHVAVDIVGVDGGIDGSITAPLVSGVPQDFSYVLSTVDNTIIQDKDSLNAIAMLIDTRDGSVVNTAKAHVTSTSDIQNITHHFADEQGRAGETTLPRMYNMQGQRLSKPQKGIVIVDRKKIVF